MAGTRRAPATASFTDSIAEVGGLPPIDRLLHPNFATYRPGDLNVKLDRMSMARGLEARSPFLDPAVIELMADVRARDKLTRRRCDPKDLTPPAQAP